MSLERALETQRLRLLRLVTGWLAVVTLMSVGPVAVPLPRCVRSFLSDLLARAECAVQNLIFVSARVQAGENWFVANDVRGCPVPLRDGSVADDVPSVAVLIRRMKAVRRMLLALPRYGRRLLRRLRPARSVSPPAFEAGSSRDVLRSAFSQWIVPGVERPPDTACLNCF